jgi:hypothetical protein
VIYVELRPKGNLEITSQRVGAVERLPRPHKEEVMDIESDCFKFGHTYTITFKWRRFKRIYFIRCWDCDLRIGPCDSKEDAIEQYQTLLKDPWKDKISDAP